MEVFSLEDDDCSDMFITQTSSLDAGCSSEMCQGEINGGIESNEVEGNSGLVQLVYEDISDDDFEVPSSQMNLQTASGGTRVNSRKSGGKLGVAAAVSKRKFAFASEERIEYLRRLQLKKRSEKKMNWGVNAYNEWRDERLRTFNYDFGIYMANLNDLPNLTKENFEYAMVRFITKTKGGMYPGHTLYQLCTAIQKYLNVNKIPWKIVKGDDFEEIKIVLDNVMKERAQANIGMVHKQAEVIIYEYENELWDKGLLGESNPDILRNTVLFLIGMNCILRAGDEHYYLRRDMPDKLSQLQFRKNQKGQRCIVYTEDIVTKANDGGLNNMKNERKIVWVYPSSNVSRCPVRLVEKYLNLCPKYYGKANFYLRSLEKPTHNRWYASQVVGQNTLGKVIKTMLYDAHIDGYFTRHSLRRTGTSRLFQAGVDKKLIKEISGHIFLSEKENKWLWCSTDSLL